MSNHLVRIVGEALYGSRWQTDLARELEMSDRHVRRLASGEAVVTQGIATDLLRVATERASRIKDAIRALREATNS